MKIHFDAADTPLTRGAFAQAVALHGQTDIDKADVIVALGGDGFMLKVLHEQMNAAVRLPVFGVHFGTIGFLVNARTNTFTDIERRVKTAKSITLTPLLAAIHTDQGSVVNVLAINEIALRRSSGQAASLKVSVNEVERIADLSGDGVLLSTPAGSAAYNASAGGPVLPLGSQALALTGIAVGRPRRWTGAVLPARSTVQFEVLQPGKRPVSVDADGIPQGDALRVTVRSAPQNSVVAMFDPDHDLDDRLIAVQFVS